jgi:hypothetical protein
LYPYQGYIYFDPESCAGCSDTIGVASLARQARGDDPDKKENRGLPGWGLGVSLKTSPRKSIFVEKLLKSDTGHTTQHEQSFKSGQVELDVSVYKWPTAEPEYKIDILIVQEVRWLGRSVVEKKDCTIYYSQSLCSGHSKEDGTY